MVLVGTVNLVICLRTYFLSQESIASKNKSYVRTMRTLGLVYVLVGAYRTVFVSDYLTQRTWFDSLANSPLLIRCMAFFAEISFGGLFALALLKFNEEISFQPKRAISNFLKKNSPYILWGCICFAQLFAFSGLITKNETFFAIEETLWSLAFLSIIPLAFMQFQVIHSEALKNNPKLFLLRNFTRMTLAWSIIYCCYGLILHLPLESWPEAITQWNTGVPAIRSGFDAVVDAFSIVHETKVYSDWGFGFLFWHSSYFSICVWLALFLMQAPRRVD